MFSPLVAILLSLSSQHALRVYHDPLPVEMTDSVVSISSGGEGAVSVKAEARVALEDIKERPGLSEGSWCLMLRSVADTLTISLRHGNSDFGDFLDNRYTLIEAHRNGSLFFSGKVDAFATHRGAYNTLTAECDTTGHLRISGGSKERVEIFDSFIPLRLMPETVSVSATGRADVALFCCETVIKPSFMPETHWTPGSLAEHIRTSTDPAEGFWRYLDRENDPEYARPGGRYTLATVRNTAGGYDIIYVEGAMTYADRWKPMMLKGRLGTTIFSNHYDLRWIDSSFEEITEDIHADITDNAILALSFPLLKTVMRFSKVPMR